MNGVTRTIGSIILGFEFIIIFLGSLVLYGLDAFAPLGWPDWSALIVGAGVLLLSLAALATMRSRLGLWLGWTVQGLVVIGGFALPGLFFVGGLFGAIWWYGLRAGRRIEMSNAAQNSPEPAGS